MRLFPRIERRYLLEYGFKSGRTVRQWVESYSINRSLNSWAERAVITTPRLLAFRLEDLETVVLVGSNWHLTWRGK